VTLLSAEHLSKSYSGVHALTDVLFHLEQGEIHALVGENGAGKSTLIKILTGALVPEAGTVLLEGTRLPLGDSLATRRRGVSAVYQEFTLIPHLSIVDNIFLGREIGGVFLDRTAMLRKASALLQELGVSVGAAAIVSTLSVAHQQMVEIARALASEAKVIVLDEPTATLSSPDVDRLHTTLRRLRATGLGIVYISHRLDEIFSVADRVTVLRDGHGILTRYVGELNRSDLVRAMVGREVSEEFPGRTRNPGRTVLEVCEARCPPRFSSVTLQVREGEVLGLAGLVGSGRTSVALALAGALPGGERFDGQISIDGQPVRFRSPSEALLNGVAYITEDRKRSGLFPMMSTAANMTMACLEAFTRRGLLSSELEERAVRAAAERFTLQVERLNRPVRTLSGGNQQKALLARFLMTRRKLVILDEPTRGVDVGARAEIYHVINQLASEGLAILMISSDLPEVIGMSDRVVVMRDGRTRGMCDRHDCSPEQIMALATAN
jgi:ribose transport system ATP-binding protein